MKNLFVEVVEAMFLHRPSQQFPRTQITIIQVFGLVFADVELAVDCVSRFVDGVEHDLGSLRIQ
jgi:hypothetical protein